MKTAPVDVEDLNEGQKFLDVDGEICTIDSVELDADAPQPCCEYCSTEEYYWVHFTRPNGEEVQHRRLWKLDTLNVILSNQD